MIVKIAPLGERVVEVNVESGTTIGEALEIAGVNLNGRDVRINNAEATLDTTIEVEDAVITLANKMKGGR
jgi:putative ubiquitin-RnfH superfamily antitoxin RatB of RatAB toxin-antitoxin module